jgi:hypothetical protein
MSEIKEVQGVNPAEICGFDSYVTDYVLDPKPCAAYFQTV